MADQAANSGSLQRAPLDDIMLAMDVVDTLRHREALIERELGSAERDEQLIERLRKVYASQGIEVTDEILKEGIAALKEDRFVYRPPPRSAATRWAHVYIDRGRWALGLLAIVAVAAIAYAANWFLVVEPQQRFASDLESTYQDVLAVSAVPEAERLADTLHTQARTALQRGDQAESRTALDSLQALRAQLERAYELRISPGPDTGFWRIPDLNVNARNYYLVVEAFDANGRRLTLPIRNEETGEVEEVSRWGLRVDEETFEQVRVDKEDDGIIQDDLFGEKQVGHLEPDYFFPTTGAAVTDWSEW